MHEGIFLSVVIPAFNEEENISGTIKEVTAHLEGKDFAYEVIVVDDGSTDATVRKARESGAGTANFKVIENARNRGKGAVVKDGMLVSEGEYRLFMDADNSTSIRELDKLMSGGMEGVDISIASRRIKGSHVEMPFKRAFLGIFFIIIAKIILGIKVNDFNCGFKLFRKEAAKDIFRYQSRNDWSFDAEVLFIAQKRGYRIREIPVDWVYKPTSKVRPLRDGINTIKSLFEIKIRELKGFYPSDQKV